MIFLSPQILFRIYYFLRLFYSWLSTTRSWDFISSPEHIFTFSLLFSVNYSVLFLKGGTFFLKLLKNFFLHSHTSLCLDIIFNIRMANLKYFLCHCEQKLVKIKCKNEKYKRKLLTLDCSKKKKRETMKKINYLRIFKCWVIFSLYRTLLLDWTIVEVALEG